MIHLKNKLFRGVLALAGFGFLLLAVIHRMDLSPAVRSGIHWGVVLALCSGFLSFISIHWAFRRRDQVFFGTLFGGMILKFVVLAITFMVLLHYKDIPINTAAVLVSMAVMTFLFDMLEIGFLPGNVRS